MWREFMRPRLMTIEKAPEVRTFTDLIEDIWALLLDSLNQTKAPVRRGHEWADRVLTMIESLPEFQRLHRRCGLDPWRSLVSTSVLMEALAKALPEFAKVVDDAERMQDELRGLADLQAHGVVVSALSGPTHALALLDAADLEYADLCDASAADIRQCVRDACEAAGTRISELEDIVEAMPGNGWGQGKSTGTMTAADVRQREKLANKVARGGKIKRILQMAGRMIRVAERVQSSKVDTLASEVVGIERGADTDRLLPSSLLGLVGGPAMETHFYTQFLQEDLSQYKMVGRDKVARGPVVLLMDCSGSMSGPREEWAKAVGWALAKLAAKQSRSFIAAEFNTKIVKKSVFVIEAGQDADTEALMRWLTHFTASGGTSFDGPLDWAMGQIESSPAFKKADIVLVTDGQCGVSDAWLTQFQAKRRSIGTRLLGVGIACRVNLLATLCDDVARVDDLDPDGPHAAVVFSV